MSDRLLYLVRHGMHDKAPDTEGPDGNEDGPLNADGRRQAELLGDRLSGIAFAAIHHSTLQRATSTARALAGHLPGVPIHGDDLLRECIPMTPPRALLTQRQAAFFGIWPQHILDHGRTQAATAVRRYAGPGALDGPMLLVTHGNLIAWFVCEALDIPRHRWLGLPLHYNCGLTVLIYRAEAPPILATYNDTGHLPTALRGTDYPPEQRI